MPWPPARAAAALTGVWGAALAHWLFWAYRLEFLGHSVFAAVWGASLLFLAANTAVVVGVVVAARRALADAQSGAGAGAGAGAGTGTGAGTGLR